VAGARGERVPASEHGGEASKAAGAAAGALPEEGTRGEEGKRGGAHLVADVGERRATATKWRAWATATEWTATE
jgi:hypothetical protein